VESDGLTVRMKQLRLVLLLSLPRCERMAEEPNGRGVRLDLRRSGIDEDDAVSTTVQNRFKAGLLELHLLQETLPYFLGSLAFGDVLVRPQHLDGLSSRVAHNPGFLVDVTRRAVGAHDAVIDTAGTPRSLSFR